MYDESTLTAEQEEWLHRIALHRPLDLMPARVADALIAVGLAARAIGGTVKATGAGKLYLKARGIATVVSRRL